MDKSRKKIQGMFDEIAGRYDFLNHLFTMKMDLRWRREIVKEIERNNYPKDLIIDLATGTGDLSLELLKLKPEKLFAADISYNMLALQKKKISSEKLVLLQCDSLHLPFADNSIDIITIGFGIRNFEFMEKCLDEINRVLKKNGQLVIIEMFSNNDFKTKLFNFYFGKVMPVVGNLISGSKYAYSYLHKSVANFYSVKDFVNVTEKHNFKIEKVKNNFLGVVNTVYFKKN
ncbi:MAG: ubiquinone/menaquinone biosynthesis methyltransferase [Ignavibacteria bacterium]|nr:ubiquinone/menaquinone biosynthesis methyltransferase [Ignavibacteria bacterium]